MRLLWIKQIINRLENDIGNERSLTVISLFETNDLINLIIFAIVPNNYSVLILERLGTRRRYVLLLSSYGYGLRLPSPI